MDSANPNNFPGMNPTRDSGMSFSSILFSIVGLGFLGAAGFLTYWIITVIRNFLYEPDRIVLLDKILKTPAAENLIKGVFDGKEFAIATNDFPKYFLFVFVCFMLLSSLGRIAGALISKGAALLINAKN